MSNGQEKLPEKRTLPGVVIPYHVLDNKKIGPNAKILYGMLGSRSIFDDRKFASFNEIANRLGVTVDGLETLANKLIGENLVPLEVMNHIKKEREKNKGK